MAKPQANTKTPTVPIFSDDSERVQEVRRRHRLLCGEWRTDLETYILSHISGARKKLWGRPATSFSFLKTIVEQMAVRYNQSPVVRNVEYQGAHIDAFVQHISDSGLWQLMQQHEMHVYAFNENLVQVTPTPLGLVFELVRPDLVELTPNAHKPAQPVKARVWAEYEANGQCDWVLETWSIEEALSPYFRLEDEQGRDVSARYGVEPLIGTQYPFFDDAAQPLLPLALYHKMPSTHLWCTRHGAETVDASYELGMLYTYWTHCVKNASFPLRVTVDVEPLGAVSEDGRTKIMDTDPTGMARFRATPNGQPQFHQFDTAVDPAALHAVFVERERKLIRNAGISESDLKEGADPMSGRALALTREAQRTLQAKYEPQFRLGDEALLQAAAAAWNYGCEQFGYGQLVPTDGWSISYPGVPRSTEELAQQQQKDQIMLDMGLTSRLRIFRRENPGLTDAEALAEMQTIADEEAMVAALRRPIEPDPTEQPKIGGTSL